MRRTEYSYLVVTSHIMNYSLYTEWHWPMDGKGTLQREQEHQCSKEENGCDINIAFIVNVIGFLQYNIMPIAAYGAVVHPSLNTK